MNIRTYVSKGWRSFSFVGLVMATLFFAASLTPSLLPRPFIVQGILSGLAIAVGYGIGVFFVWLWLYLELPPPGPRIEHIGKWIASVSVAVVAIGFLWRATIWQNSIRQLMEMEPVETAYPWRVAWISLAIGVVLIAAVRGLRGFWRLVDRWVSFILPQRRIAFVVSTLIVVIALFVLMRDVAARFALDTADAMFLQLDRVVDEGIEQPTDLLATGSKESLIPWDTLGRRGKDFIAASPTQQRIGEFSGKDAMRPLRVYVGLGTEPTAYERAELALKELIRVGGFERSVLVVATPTGTGWLDPAAVDTLEYLHGGDTAIVTMQYSYLPSWITILVDPHRSGDSARALFDRVYDYWKTLPHDQRPKLYLHGLSLGALGSEASGDLFTVFEDPIQGGVWSGPPFPSPVWGRITKHRNAGSPMWLPRFRDGSMVRFTARKNAINEAGERWGLMRFVYIQHASDPMTFFSPELLYRRPDWLVGPRGPDVSPYLRWVPIVTFLQTGFDLPMATSVPHGYGHNFAPPAYIDAWVAVTQPEGWSEDDSRRLVEWFQREATPTGD